MQSRANTRVSATASIGFHYAQALIQIGRFGDAKTVLLQIGRDNFSEREQAEALLERIESR